MFLYAAAAFLLNLVHVGARRRCWTAESLPESEISDSAYRVSMIACGNVVENLWNIFGYVVQKSWNSCGKRAVRAQLLVCAIGRLPWRRRRRRAMSRLGPRTWGGEPRFQNGWARPPQLPRARGRSDRAGMRSLGLDFLDSQVSGGSRWPPYSGPATSIPWRAAAWAQGLGLLRRGHAPPGSDHAGPGPAPAPPLLGAF